MNNPFVELANYLSQPGMFYFLNDHLGTPQKIVDSSAQVVWAAAYLPFGKAQIKPETVTNNLRFPGQYFDAESGLHYNWNRYYDPDTGRYLTADPIGLSGGINLYVYVMNNPVNRIDLKGLFTCDSSCNNSQVQQIQNATILIGNAIDSANCVQDPLLRQCLKNKLNKGKIY